MNRSIDQVGYLPFGGQGITLGEGHWYYSTTWWRLERMPHGRLIWREGYIYKLTAGLGIANRRYFPLRDRGYDHIGGLDFHRGKVYASLEHVGYKEPMLVSFNQELELESCSILPELRHFSWVAIDDDGFLYSSEFDPCSEIRIYSAYSHPEASLEGKIPLDQTLHKVQGGCFYEGRLYLSCDDEGKSIYAVDSSGRVSKVLDTEIEWEMEDLYIDEEGEIYFIDHQGSLYKVSPGL